MHLSVQVRAGSLTTSERRLTTQCMTVFVVPGEDGRAESIPPMPLQSEEDLRLDAHARDLIERRASLLSIPVSVSAGDD
jgi:4-hydroxybenzoyl-CoA thioesterase